MAWLTARVSRQGDAAIDDLPPTAILHLTLPEQLAQSLRAGEHRLSNRVESVEEVGFVHCSYPHQIERTANHHYGDVTEIAVMQIDPELCPQSPLRIEQGVGQFEGEFPHLYGPVPLSAIVRTWTWQRTDGAFRVKDIRQDLSVVPPDAPRIDQDDSGEADVSLSNQAYDRIGVGYSRLRQPDPRWAAAIQTALGDAETVVNVGAGAGSYEPKDADVVAVEPSAEMIGQRPAAAAPVVRAVAERLPFADASFDVALAVLTIHHWTDWRAGIAELRRVAHRQVLLTFDMGVVAGTWLADYLPEVIAFDRDRTPSIPAIIAELDGAEVTTLPVLADMRDAVMLAHWNRPESYLDPDIRAAASGFAQSPPELIDRFVTDLRRDLDDGTWDDRYGHLRDQRGYDGGYRLLTAG